MTPLTDLIARVEKLEGPDRAIDYSLADRYARETVGIDVPHYTASLDASLALVERVLPRWSAHIYTGDPSLHHTRPMARLTPHNDYDEGWATGLQCRQDVFANTPAVALILALLRALEAQESSR